MAIPSFSPGRLRLAISISAGILVAAAAQHYLVKREDSFRSQFALTPVLVVTHDLRPGMPINEQNVATRELNQARVTKNLVQDNDRSKLIGALARSRLHVGDLLRWTDVSIAGKNDFSRQIPLGARAVAIAVQPTSALSPLLTPGDRVDILATSKSRGHSTLLATNCPLLSVGSRIERGPPESVTVALTVPQTLRVVTATSQGHLTLALRHPDETVQSRTPQGIDPSNDSEGNFYREIR